MVHYILADKVTKFLDDGESHIQSEINPHVGNVNRAILTGYLRCMADLGKIKSKNAGKAKIYFLKKRIIKK
jgi:predicted transcriptional regulator